jgi:hypothetical protein
MPLSFSSGMTKSARQVDYIHHRIQERIILNDDELDRLSRQLQTYRAAIAGSHDRLKQLENHLKIARALTTRNPDAISSIYKAQKEAEHFQALQDLQSEQAAEIQAVQREFQEMIASIPNLASGEEQRRLFEVTAEIQRLHVEIDRMAKAQIAESQPEDLDDTAILPETTQAPLIAELERHILALTAERAADLAEAKTELTRYVEILEEMEQSFLNESSRLCHRLEVAEQSYVLELSRLKDSHHHKRRILLSKKQQAKQKSDAASLSLRNIERRNGQTMAESVRKMDLIRLNSVKKPTDLLPNDDDIDFRQEHNKLTSQRDMKLAVLYELRSANEKMKREIGRLTFQLRYPKRSDGLWNGLTIGAER